MSHIFGTEKKVIHRDAGIAGTGIATGIVNTRRCGVHFNLHALHYASAVIEGQQCVLGTDGKRHLLFPQLHAERLLQSARTVGILNADGRSGPSVQEIIELTRLVAARNWQCRETADPLYLRPWLGESSCQLGVGSHDGWMLAITSRTKTPYLGDSVKTGITVWAPGPDQFCRGDHRTGFPSAKWTGNYYGYKWKQAAARFGAVEVLQYDLHRNIAETTGSNLFAVIDDVIYTPELGCILPGITRQRVIEILRACGRRVEEVTLTRAHLLEAQEVFVTGTWSGVVPVRFILEGMDAPTPLPGKFHDQNPGPVAHLAKTVYNKIISHQVDLLPPQLVVDHNWWLEI